MFISIGNVKVAAIFAAMFLVAGGTTIANAQTPTHATAAGRYFPLNTHPQDRNKPIDLSGRRPNFRREIGIVLEHDSPVITLRGAGNIQSSGILPAGVLVMVDEETRVALWVAICGNEVVTTGWRPTGKIVSYPEAYEKECSKMQLVLEKLDSMDAKLDILVSRPVPATLTKADLDASFAAFTAKYPPFEKKETIKGNWYTHSWRDHTGWMLLAHFGAGFLLERLFNKDNSPSGQIGGGTTGNGH